jgi:KaiC/GvpD/RAD55 family RecA-like ATPase
MQVTHLEKIFYHYIDTRPEIENLVNSRFFETPEIRELQDIRKEFRVKYHKPPTSSQLKEIVKVKGLQEKLSPEKIDALYEIKMESYDPDWVQETTESWIEFKNLDISVMDLVQYMKTTKINSENIKDVVQTAKSIITDRNNIDFQFDTGLDFFDPGSHKQITHSTFSTGYPYLDAVLGGGYSPKTLIALAGMPKVGKSIWLSNLAAQGIRNGYNTAFISLEMSDRKVVKRLGANLLGIKVAEYNKIAEDTFEIKKKISALGSENPMQVLGSMYIKEYPTSTASVVDVENWLKRMEEMKGIKFRLVVLDYINIMRNWRNPNTENTYMKIKQIAEDLRAMAMRNGWTILTATQFTRAAFSASDVILEQISESSGLIHTVDSLFGIIQDEMMYMNQEYYLKNLANRDEGFKNSKKKFLINYDYMRIIEDLNSEIIQSQL